MKLTFYHYTRNTNAASISEDMVIWRSQQRAGAGDARYGDGVYLTRVAPSAGKRFIAYNNYDGRNKRAIANMIRQGRVDCYIQVELDDREVYECQAGDGRIVYLYPGDLELTSGRRWEIGYTA